MFLALVPFIPVITTGIRLLEKLFTGKGRGAEKKEMLTENLMPNLYGTLAETGHVKEFKDVPYETLKPLIDALADVIVSSLNATGEFKSEPEVRREVPV